MIEHVINNSRFLRRRKEEHKQIGKDEMEGLEKVVRRISEVNDMKVQFTDESTTYINHKYINIPKLSLNEVEGLAAHVAGHVGYGSFSPSLNTLRQYLRSHYNLDMETSNQIVTICEDFRVDKINERIFPGFARELRILYHNVLSCNTVESFYRELLCYFEDLIPDFEHPLDPDQMELIDKAKQIIKNHQHAGATVFAADLLGKFFKRENDKEKEPQQPPTPQPEDDEEQEESEEQEDNESPCSAFEGGEVGDLPIKSKPCKNNPPIKKGETIRSESLEEDIKSKIDKKLMQYIQKFEELDEKEQEEIVNRLLEESESLPEKDTDLEEEADNLRQQLKYDCVHGLPIKGRRECIIEDIEKGLTYPLKLTHSDIVKKHLRLITQLKDYFHFRMQEPEKQYKSGRLNNMFIRAIVSDYNRVFSRKVEIERIKMTLLVDVSGSMGGSGNDKMEAAKEAMVIFAEALDEVANTRIVTFTGHSNAYNQVIKNFNEKINPEKFDMIGSRKGMCENLDGVSVLNEALLNPKGVLLVFSDGRPAGDCGYGLETAIPDIQTAWTIVKTIFAFSINSEGEYLQKMYRKNFVNINYQKPMDLVNNVLKMARLMIEQIY